MNIKRTLLFVVTILVLIVVTFIIKGTVLKGHPVVKLSAAEPLVGAISQGLATSGSTGSLPVFGKDYTLQNIHYFDNRSWVVATVVPLRIKTDDAIIIMRQASGTYQVVLGPGTAFPVNYLEGLPTDVSQYLINQGVTYGTPANQ